MMNESEFTEISSEIRAKLLEKFGIKSRDLAQAFRKAGRRLPRRIRRHGETLAKSEVLARHPKLIRQVNAQQVARARRDVLHHLETIDPADLRRGRMLSLAGTLAANILLIGLGFAAWFWWQSAR